METYEIDSIKVEKEKAMRRYQTFRKLASVVRTVEILVAIMLISVTISWSSSFIPSAVEFSGKFLRRVSSLLFSPHFVFLVGNVIIITLFAYSSKDSPAEEEGREPLSENVINNHVSDVAVASGVTEEEVVQEKEVKEVEVEKVYTRSQSTAARMEMVVVKDDEKEKEVCKKELRRSETQPRRKSEDAKATAAAAAKRRFEEDELSNEEFRRKVEAFIEKQQRFLRDESKVLVVSNVNHNNYNRCVSM